MLILNDFLRKLQLTELEILIVVDDFCTKHGIKYSLYCGTLLGAVRHKGFIPWDDDLDICMLREDYERFVEFWNTEKPNGYILQNKENTPAFTQSFTKIRKDNTAFVQSENEIGKYHTGIFIDIMPLDRYPDKKVSKIVFKWNCLLYQLYTREFIPPLAGVPVKAVSKFFLAVKKGKARVNKRNKLLKRITKYNSDKSLKLVGIECTDTMAVHYPADLMDHFAPLEFENKNFLAVEDRDEMLTRYFGNYMQLPPESERVLRHHPILVDFENNCSNSR